MGEGSGGLEEDRDMKQPHHIWGLRPWKRHSTILMVVGLLYMLIGWSYIISTPSRLRENSLAVVLQFAPIQFWGGLFVMAGLMSMISSRWPPMTETWGYMVLTGLSSGWSATYLTGILFFHAPAGVSITQTVLWGLLGFMWWAISGLVNPDHTGVIEDGRR